MSFSKDSHHSGLKRAYNVLSKEFYIGKKKPHGSHSPLFQKCLNLLKIFIEPSLKRSELRAFTWVPVLANAFQLVPQYQKALGSAFCMS